jgi:threonine dehydratase
MEITRADIEAAAERIEGWVRRTPVLEVQDGLVLKLDLLQPTGSFKVRGAFSLLTSHPEEGQVVAASGGNFGLAVAYAASRLDKTADIFVPSTSPDAKIARIRALGARVHVIEGFYAEALAASREFSRGREILTAHAYDDPYVVAGQGTCGREILAQIPAVDTVVVAVGGAGLIGGIASWVRDDARVIAVETEGTASLHAALAARRPVTTQVGGLAADSLGSARVGEIGFEAASRWVDQSVVVCDDDVVAAQHWLWDQCRLIAEPGAATAVAALTSGAYRRDPEERVCVLVCGANTDPSFVTRSHT